MNFTRLWGSLKPGSLELIGRPADWEISRLSRWQLRPCVHYPMSTILFIPDRHKNRPSSRCKAKRKWCWLFQLNYDQGVCFGEEDSVDTVWNSKTMAGQVNNLADMEEKASELVENSEGVWDREKRSAEQCRSQLHGSGEEVTISMMSYLK